MSENKIELKNVVMAWWKFFWRYALVWIMLLITHGLLIRILSRYFTIPSYYLWAANGVNLFLNLFVSFLIFKLVIGKQIGKSGLIIVPSSVKRRNPHNPQSKINLFWTTLAWWNYFWRFALFAFAIGFCTNLLLERLGYAAVVLTKYPKIIGNISVIPASLLVFIILMWRSEKRRKLDLVPAQAE